MRLCLHGIPVRSAVLTLTVGCLGAPGLSPAMARAASPLLQIEVDARDLPRKLLHTQLRIACEPGSLALWYPRWIPGTHAPSGPLETIGGLRLETPEGKVIPWRRDDVELYRVTCEVPSGVHEIRARLDTICNAAGRRGQRPLELWQCLGGDHQLSHLLALSRGTDRQGNTCRAHAPVAGKVAIRHGPEVGRGQERADRVRARIIEYTGRFALDRG